MRELESVQQPPNWSESLAKPTWFGVAVFVVAIVYCVTKAVGSYQQGSTVGSIIMGGLATACGFFLAALAITVVLSARRCAEYDSRGTIVRVNPLIMVTYGLGLASAALSTSLYIAHADKEGVRDLLGGTVTRYLMGLLLAISAISLIAMLRTREPGRIQIGPDGVQHADIFGTRTVKWGELVDITDSADKKTRNPIVLRTSSSKPIVVSNADRYGDSGPAIYWMVRHYWKHPEDRDELTDGRALERLRNEQFAPE